MQKDILGPDELVTRLSTDLPGVKLLAMGQTVYWDEPMKAILKRLLDENLPDRVMVAGVHDADYFSKIPANTVPEGWHILPHNDGSTKDMWVAAGEISRMFGSETIPYRDLLTEYGVQLDKIARDYPGGRQLLIDTATEAWGWRGVVHSDRSNNVICCVPLDEALPHLIELLRWGFDHTIDSLASCYKPHAQSVADTLIHDIKYYAGSHTEASVADLYCEMLDRVYAHILGYHTSNLEITRATQLFQFNKSTAALPRFSLLEMFLNPATRKQCQEAYDAAVEGSDAYTLDRFPEGAIPFDLVVPCIGRGTICLRKGRVVIDMDDPIVIPCSTPIETTSALVELFESQFGKNVALVGKALTLVLMITSEFIFVLNEEASAYVPRCEKMASIMKQKGVPKSFYPILRIRYKTWDSISASDVSFELPAYIAAASNQAEMTATEFGDSWKSIVECQEYLLERTSQIKNMDDLLQMLSERQPIIWGAKTSDYKKAVSEIRSLSSKTEPLKAESIRLRDLSHTIKQEIQQMEINKGEHFRTMVKPLMDKRSELEWEGITSGQEWNLINEQLSAQQAVRAEIERQIAEKRNEAKVAMDKSLEIKNIVRSMEKSPEAENARQTIRKIAYEAELARLWIVRSAILTTKGLKYTNNRPSAWWFMMADKEMKWFNKVAQTAQFYFEDICI